MHKAKDLWLFSAILIIFVVNQRIFSENKIYIWFNILGYICSSIASVPFLITFADDLEAILFFSSGSYFKSYNSHSGLS